jgi:hypothetical protein
MSLKVFWPSVKHGGVYFIADLAMSYFPKWGGGAVGSDTMMNHLKMMLASMISNEANGVPIVFYAVSNEAISFEFTQEYVALIQSKVPDLVQPKGHVVCEVIPELDRLKS